VTIEIKGLLSGAECARHREAAPEAHKRMVWL